MINFSNPQTRYLIDYANLKQGLIKHQNDFLSKKEFKNFAPTITRFKGLGEISPHEFKMFIGEDMKLVPVISKGKIPIQETLSYYMGKNTPERQQFIIDNLKIEEQLLNDNA